MNVERGRPSDLTPLDYDQIRKTVLEVFRTPGMNSRDWEDVLATSGFNDHGNSFFFRPRDSQKTESLAEIAERVRISNLMGYTPTHGYDSEHFLQQHPDWRTNPGHPYLVWKPHESCSVNLNFHDGIMEVHMTMGSRSLNTSVPVQEPIYVHYRDSYGKTLWLANMRYSWLDNPPATIYDFEFGFDYNRLNYVEVTELRCVNNGCGTPKDGLRYVCSAESQLIN